MADLVRFAILHGFKSQGGFAVDLKRPNRWCKDHVLMISSPSARARPGGGWLRDGAVPVADVDSFATSRQAEENPRPRGWFRTGQVLGGPSRYSAHARAPRGGILPPVATIVCP